VTSPLQDRTPERCTDDAFRGSEAKMTANIEGARLAEAPGWLRGQIVRPWPP
jgi:hypothetical protein